jgi:hypothetical protein
MRQIGRLSVAPNNPDPKWPQGYVAMLRESGLCGELIEVIAESRNQQGRLKSRGAGSETLVRHPQNGVGLDGWRLCLYSAVWLILEMELANDNRENDVGDAGGG